MHKGTQPLHYTDYKQDQYTLTNAHSYHQITNIIFIMIKLLPLSLANMQCMHTFFTSNHLHGFPTTQTKSHIFKR